MIKLLFPLAAVLLSLGVAGCGSPKAAAPGYRKALTEANHTIKHAQTVQAAATDKNARQSIQRYIDESARQVDAYKANPSEQSKVSLKKSLDVLNTATAQAESK